MNCPHPLLDPTSHHLSCSPALLASLQLLLLPASGPRHLLSPQICAEPRSFVSFRSQVKCHLLQEVFPEHHCWSVPLQVPQCLHWEINSFICFIPPAASSTSGTSLATCTEIPSAHSSVWLASGSLQIHLKHRKCCFPQAQEADAVPPLHRGEPWRGCSRALKPGLLAWGLSSGWDRHFPSSFTCQALSSMLTDTDPVSPTSILWRTVPIPVVRRKVETEAEWLDHVTDLRDGRAGAGTLAGRVLEWTLCSLSPHRWQRSLPGARPTWLPSGLGTKGIWTGMPSWHPR